MARVFDDLELGYVKEVLASGRLGWQDGGMVTRFEEAFAELVGAKHAIGRNSAMTGLAQAVAVSGAGTSWEVLCDPIVHFGGLASLYFNAVPRFVDVKYDTFLMDPVSLRANISPRSKAVIVTHMWGQCAEMDQITAICEEHNLFLIEDCAHVVGATWQGKHAGTWGDLGVFSFQQGKHLPTGDGAMIVTNRGDLRVPLAQATAHAPGGPPRRVRLGLHLGGRQARPRPRRLQAGLPGTGPAPRLWLHADARLRLRHFQGLDGLRRARLPRALPAVHPAQQLSLPTRPLPRGRRAHPAPGDNGPDRGAARRDQAPGGGTGGSEPADGRLRGLRGTQHGQR